MAVAWVPKITLDKRAAHYDKGAMINIELHYTAEALWPQGMPIAPGLDRERSLEAFECIIHACLIEKHPRAMVQVVRCNDDLVMLNCDPAVEPVRLNRLNAEIKALMARLLVERDSWEVCMPEIVLPKVTPAALAHGHPVDRALPVWQVDPVYVLQIPRDDPDDRFLFVQVGDRVSDLEAFPYFSKSGKPIQWGMAAEELLQKIQITRVADTGLAILAHYFREDVTPTAVNQDALASIHYVRAFCRDILLRANSQADLIVAGGQIRVWLVENRINSADLLRRLKSNGGELF